MSAFRDKIYLFEEAGAQVVGISVDSFASAGEFQAKLSAGFPILSDFPNGQAGKDYGVFNEKAGIHNRTTILLDTDRIVRDVYVEPADFESHATHALEAIETLKAG